MKKNVVDLSPEELEKFATDAWKIAASEAMANGYSITGSRDGRRFLYHPDGRVEDLGPVAPLTSEEDAVRGVVPPKKSVA
jgi:hypothetical protein